MKTQMSLIEFEYRPSKDNLYKFLKVLFTILGFSFLLGVGVAGFTIEAIFYSIIACMFLLVTLSALIFNRSFVIYENGDIEINGFVRSYKINCKNYPRMQFYKQGVVLYQMKNPSYLDAFRAINIIVPNDKCVEVKKIIEGINKI